MSVSHGHIQCFIKSDEVFPRLFVGVACGFKAKYALQPFHGSGKEAGNGAVTGSELESDTLILMGENDKIIEILTGRFGVPAEFFC